MTTESEQQIETTPAPAAPAPEPTPVIRPGPDAGERLPQMIERTRRRGRRRRAPVFTPQEVATIDYKDVDRLKKLISDRGRIEPRRKTGLTAKDQRKISREIKRARQVALLPYTAEHMRQTSRFRMVTRMAQRAMRAELDDAPPSEPVEGGAMPEDAAPAEPVAPEASVPMEDAVAQEEPVAAEESAPAEDAVAQEEPVAAEASAPVEDAVAQEEPVAAEASAPSEDAVAEAEPVAAEAIVDSETPVEAESTDAPVEAESAEAPEAAANEESGA